MLVVESTRDQVLNDLKPLDRAILRAAALGLTSKQIAPLVERSPHTIDDRLKALKSRLGAIDRAHAGRMLLSFEAGRAPPNDWGPQLLGLATLLDPRNPVSGSGGSHAIIDSDTHPGSGHTTTSLFTTYASARPRGLAAEVDAGAGPAGAGRSSEFRAELSADAIARSGPPYPDVAGDREAVSGFVRAMGAFRRAVSPSRDTSDRVLPNAGTYPEGAMGHRPLREQCRQPETKARIRGPISDAMSAGRLAGLMLALVLGMSISLLVSMEVLMTLQTIYQRLAPLQP